MVMDIVEAILLIFKISGGFTKVLHLILLLAVLALLIEFLLEEGV
jgi:hypothetical protein